MKKEIILLIVMLMVLIGINLNLVLGSRTDDSDCSSDSDCPSGQFCLVDILTCSSSPWYVDNDGDGYGTGLAYSDDRCAGTYACVNNNLDCNDNDGNVYEGCDSLYQAWDSDFGKDYYKKGICSFYSESLSVVKEFSDRCIVTRQNQDAVLEFYLTDLNECDAVIGVCREGCLNGACKKFICEYGTCKTPISGDVNLDGRVDGLDSGIIKSNLKCTDCMFGGGDLDNNKIVDGNDMQKVVLNWGYGIKGADEGKCLDDIDCYSGKCIRSIGHCFCSDGTDCPKSDNCVADSENEIHYCTGGGLATQNFFTRFIEWLKGLFLK
jgi:hypothetical protein